MIVSVTVLGATARSQASIANDIVRYLEDGRAMSAAGRRPGSVIELPAPNGGTVAYYADSAGLRPGRWLLGRSGEIDPQVLGQVLSGVDPATGERLLSGSSHAERSAHARTAQIAVDPAARWYTSREVAALLGVSDSYVQRRCRAAIVSSDEGAAAGIERTADGRAWKIDRQAVDRLRAALAPKRVVVGYDLTYSVPKSVSVLWAGGDQATQAAVLDAVDEAIAAGTRYVERQALTVRVRGEQQRADGVFAADYLHATNRALEPQLHHHVVLANYGKGPDGVGHALDARMLFLHAKTASYVAAAELRHQLTARLGVVWSEVTNGIAEIEGIPAAARDEMSTRAKEIAAALDVLGYHSPRARQVAAWDTRAAKDHGVDIDALMGAWAERLTAAGYGEKVRDSVVGRVTAPGIVTALEIEELFSDLSRVAGITEHAAVFDRRRVVQVLAEFGGDRLSGDAIDELADRFLTQPAVVRLQTSGAATTGNVICREDGQVVIVPADALYSTRPMLELEARAIAYYERGRAATAGVVSDEVLGGVLADARFTRLSDEQRRFVTSLTTSGMRIQTAVGAAGTGKTVALEAAVAAWSRAGYTVIGSAVGGTQTVILGEEAHVAARTVASVIACYFNYDNIASINERTVLLVDEASLLSTQDFVLLAQAVTERGATLRLVGDPAQHSAVSAGGIFRYLVEHHKDETPALTTIYRQQGPAMAEVRLANAEYREGKIIEAFERLERDGRITEAASGEEAFDLLTCAWYLERQQRLTEPARRPTSMTAEHHFERVELTARARALLAADGTLSGPELIVGRLTFQRGDEVIARKGDHQLRAGGAARDAWLRNGSLGVVHEVRNDSLVVDFERWGRIVVPASYIDREVAKGVRGALQHSYALTTHAAQGSTFAVAVPLLTDASSREGGYVGLTRGQFDLRAVIVRRAELVTPLTDDLFPILVDETTALRGTARRLESQRAEQLALEVDPLASKVHELAQHCTLAELTTQSQADPVAAPLDARALRERARIVGMRAVIDPLPEVLAHLGQRPNDTALRSTWDQTVAAIAIWREREGAAPVDDGPAATWALGNWPTAPESQADYEAISGLIAAIGRRSTDAWMDTNNSEGRGAVMSSTRLSELMFGEGVPGWDKLSDDELRGAAREVRQEIVRHEARLTDLERIAGLHRALEETRSDHRVATDDHPATPALRESPPGLTRSSLAKYREAAEDVRTEAIRRGLIAGGRDFLAAREVTDETAPEPVPTLDVSLDVPAITR